MKLETIKKRLKGFRGVENMTSTNGNTVANQIVIYFENGVLFQSYESIIAIQMNDNVYLTSEWNYSRTTSKYLNSFLGGNKVETERKIKEGIYRILKQTHKKI